MPSTKPSLPRPGVPEASSLEGYDLLRFRPLKALVRWGSFPYVFQAALLMGFVAMAVFAWNLYPPDGVPAKLYAKSNLVNLLVWGLWWPAMVWVAILFGRVWCAVCPLELVANGTERIGRRLGVRQRRLGPWLRAGWLVVALYAFVQLLVAGVELHRIPAYTSLFLWSLLGTAALAGFLFQDRAFCRGFCPVGLLLGTYGRGAILAVRPVSTGACKQCTDKGCTRAAHRTNFDARSCPSRINPARLKSNADCLVCGQCVKACGPDNMGLFLRPPFQATDARTPMASWPVVLFILFLSGFVTYELFSEWKAAQALFHWVPSAVANALGASAYEGWLKGVWTIFAVPLVVWLVLGGMVLLFRGAGTMAEAWRRLALPLAVVIAAGQMAKGLAKFVSWVGFLPFAARDPAGTETARAYVAETLTQPASVLPMLAVSILSMLLLLAATWYALREVRLSQDGAQRGCQVAVLLLSLGSLFLVFGWGFLQ